MPIEFQCGQCQSILRVPDQHAGKQARCPQCEFINMIPMATPPNPDFGNQENANPASFAEPTATFPAAEKSSTANPYHAPSTAAPTSYGEPHRGSLILVLGIISIVSNCCMIPGICAWSMGSTDLHKIANGRMDPSGKQLTQVGMILGIIGTCLGLGGFLLTGLALLVN